MTEKKLEFHGEKLTGTIQIPGDKSISHRAVMFGSLAEGVTTINNFLLGEDCLSTIKCFQTLGVKIHIEENSTVKVFGKGWSGLNEPDAILDVGNSGTTARLLLGILATRPFHSIMIGDESIAKRPMDRVTKPLKQMNAHIDGRGNGTYTPLAIRGGQTKGVHYQSPIASAQVKSSILLAGLMSKGETAVTEPARSRDHTERMLRAFGVKVDQDGLTVKVQGEQTLYATNVNVPGDISSAAFFLVAAAIVPQSELKLVNVGLNPTRTGIIDALERMGADLTIKNRREENYEPVADITVRTSKLTGIEINGDLIPRLIDEIPIIALLATQAEGKTVIKDAAELKVKETNRIDTVVNMLLKLGAKIEATEDGMIIHGKSPLRGGKVSSFGDHRIGMMCAIASLITDEPVYLEKSEAVSVSYPTFFNHLNEIID